MKIAFYSVLGPLLRRNRLFTTMFCAHPAVSFAPTYVGLLGVLGVVLSGYDIYRIIHCGPTLPGYLARERLKNGMMISPQTERDCKLISLVLSLEYYFFLLVGLMTNNPIFYLPFLVLYAFIIALEFLVFVTRAATVGLDTHKKGLVMTLFMMYNWSSVACTFARTLSCCDL